MNDWISGDSDVMPLTLALSEPSGKVIEDVLKHVLDAKGWLGTGLTTFQAMLLIAAGLVLLVGVLIDKRSAVPKGLFRNAMESLLIFIRNEMVRPVMGGHKAAHGHDTPGHDHAGKEAHPKDAGDGHAGGGAHGHAAHAGAAGGGAAVAAHHPADTYVPFFCTLFVFIFTLNLLGIVPGCGTATSNLFVTGALAGIVLLVSVGSGIVFHGEKFFTLFVPSGVPKFVVPLLFILELFGFFIKHAVLMVRLFANMIAGHLIIGSFLGLIFLFKSYGVAGPSVLLALFVTFLELLVAFLQAYVFTLLSVLFVGGMVHPEH